jgi:hypothetical protein
MIKEFPVRYELNNSTKVLVNQIDEATYDFHLTRLNGMKHSFTWTTREGVLNSGAETALGSGSFLKEEAEALEAFHKLNDE